MQVATAGAVHGSAGSPRTVARGLDFRLLNEFQRNFPLVCRPFHVVAERLGCAEREVIEALRCLADQGLVSRVGPVFAPYALGASTLAALAAPPRRLEELARRVSVYPQVNHNYEREHRFNLWFVVTGTDRADVGSVLRAVEMDTGCEVLTLPLLDEYHIDLGFDLAGGAKCVAAPRCIRRNAACAVPPVQRRLALALQDGLELVSRPFRAPAQRVGMTEAMALHVVQRWLGEGVVKRFGVVVRHQELGYTANAMCVWNVADRQVRRIGPLLASEPSVTLCYRRRRASPHWHYNLYCMIHGRDRREVEEQVAAINARLDLKRFPSAVLFSRRRFKQRGARYGAAAEVDHGRHRPQDNQCNAG